MQRPQPEQLRKIKLPTKGGQFFLRSFQSADKAGAGQSVSARANRARQKSYAFLALVLAALFFGALFLPPLAARALRFFLAA